MTGPLSSKFMFGNDLTCERKFNNTANVCYKLLILEIIFQRKESIL